MYAEYSGVWDTIQNVVSGIGITGGTITAISKAVVAPTTANIQGVIDAFRAEGTSPPPELLNVLYGRQGQAAADNPYYTAGSVASKAVEWLPWAIGGGILLIVLMRRGK